MSSFLMLALSLAMAAWGYAGTIVHISYVPLPNGVAGQAYGSITECWIEVNEGFKFYEKNFTNLDHMVFLLTHEYGHCIREHGHNPDQCSLMHHTAYLCEPQIITEYDWLKAKEYRDLRYTPQIVVPNISLGGP